MKLLLLVLLGAVITVSCASEGTYSYSDQAAWDGVCATGKHQSPIDINEVKNTVYYGSGMSLFGGYKSIIIEKGSLKTTRFVLTSTPIYKTMPQNWPVGHTKGLQALHVQFHWGKGTEGSEHMLNGKQFIGEIHVVTRNLDQDDETASDYYAVFGFFMKVVTGNELPDMLSNSLAAMLSGSSPILNMDDLFSRYNKAIKSVFTYEGSLTTPGCDETVFWQVMEEPILVTQDAFNSLRTSGSDRVDDANNFEFNYREIQELNGRHITHRLLHQAITTPADGGDSEETPADGGDSEETCKVDCHAAQQTCMWTMSGAATSLPSLALLFAALFYLM